MLVEVIEMNNYKLLQFYLSKNLIAVLYQGIDDTILAVLPHVKQIYEYTNQISIVNKTKQKRDLANI